MEVGPADQNKKQFVRCHCYRSRFLSKTMTAMESESSCGPSLSSMGRLACGGPGGAGDRGAGLATRFVRLNSLRAGPSSVAYFHVKERTMNVKVVYLL